MLIGLLVRYRALPAEPLAEFANNYHIGIEELAESLGRLIELNIVDVNYNEYRLVKPLRDTLERDQKFNLSERQSDEFAESLLQNLQTYGEADSLPISLIDPATISAIKNGRAAPGWVHQLILPSHYIWLARERYHKRNYNESLDYTTKALELTSMMTEEAHLEALRFAGLSCARLGLVTEFADVILRIRKIGVKRAKSVELFLNGFFARLRGELGVAEKYLLQASNASKGSIDVQRELVSVLLLRRDYPQALSLSRELLSRVEGNAYVLDGYIQSVIALTPNVESLQYDAEFSRRLSQLKEVGDGPGLSFWCLRKVDVAIREGDKKQALEYSKEALKNTPNLPAAYVARARAFLLSRKYEKAWSSVQNLEELGNRRNRVRDGVEKLLLFSVRCEYNMETGRFELCRKDIDNVATYDPSLAKRLKLQLVHHVTTRATSMGADFKEWLKADV